ncbi:MAG: O-antigen ligase family protein [Candidatus Andersenbacteria bacterium]
MTVGKLHIFLLTATAVLLPAYLWRFSVAGIPTNVLEVLIIATFATGAIDHGIRTSWRRATQGLVWEVKILVLVLVLSAALSTLISPHLETSLGILKGWIILPVLYGWMVFTQNSRQAVIVNALVISGTAVALIGLTQLDSLDRVRSVYDVPNSLALYIAPILTMATWRALQGIRPGALWTASAIMAAALLAAQTVGAIIAVVFTFVLGMLFFPKVVSLTARRGLIAAGILTLLGSGILLQDKISYLFQLDSSAAVRLQLWSISWEIVTEHPLLGIGLGTFEPAYQQHLHERFSSFHSGVLLSEPLPEFVFRDPHNWVLSFWLNLGLTGLLSFATLAAVVVRKSWKNQTAICLALIAILLLGLVDTVYWKNDLAILWWMLIGFLVRRPTERSDHGAVRQTED